MSNMHIQLLLCCLSIVIRCNLYDGESTYKPPGATLHCGKSYTYNCLPGYETNDTKIVACNEDGLLSTPAPKCTSMQFQANIS